MSEGYVNGLNNINPRPAKNKSTSKNCSSNEENVVDSPNQTKISVKIFHLISIEYFFFKERNK